MRQRISDHGKEVSAQGYSGKLTLLRGSNKTEFPLSVEGDTLKVKLGLKDLKKAEILEGIDEKTEVIKPAK